jgi:hypothetical protein
MLFNQLGECEACPTSTSKDAVHRGLTAVGGLFFAGFVVCVVLFVRRPIAAAVVAGSWTDSNLTEAMAMQGASSRDIMAMQGASSRDVMAIAGQPAPTESRGQPEQQQADDQGAGEPTDEVELAEMQGNAVQTGSDLNEGLAALTDRFASDGDGGGFGRHELLQRIKIGISWLQCLGPFIFTFNIPWPVGFFDQLTSIYNIFAVDFSGLLGNLGEVACELDTSFLAGFMPHMLILPCLVLAVVVGLLVGALLGPSPQRAMKSGCCSKKSKKKVDGNRKEKPENPEKPRLYLPHKEAVLSRAIQILLFCVFMLYPGLCSKVRSRQAHELIQIYTKY